MPKATGLPQRRDPRRRRRWRIRLRVALLIGKRQRHRQTGRGSETHTLSWHTTVAASLAVVEVVQATPPAGVSFFAAELLPFGLPRT
jgi:hypothetical protein